MSAQGSAHGYSSGGRRNNGKELTGARNACFKCGHPGHWAKDCPSASDQGMYGAQMGREAYSSSSGWSSYGGGNSSSVARNECFKCGLPGHWSRDCPSAADQEMRGRLTNAQADVGGEESSIVYSYGGRKSPYWEDDSFKCGRSGHWQRECPLVNGKDDGGDGKRREFEVCLGGWPF